MFRKLKKQIRRLTLQATQTLFSFGKRKITGTPLLLLIALDLFLLGWVFDAVSANLVKAPSVYTKYPYSCQRLFETRAPLTYDDITDKIYHGKSSQTAPICRDLYRHLDDVLSDRRFEILKEKRVYLQKALQQNGYKTQNLQKKYDTNLLEKIAREKAGLEKQAKSAYGRNLSQLKELREQLRNIPPAMELASVRELQHFIDTQKSEYRSRKWKYTFLYPFIYLFYMLKFLVPLFIVSIFVFLKTRERRSEKAQLLHTLSAHLFLIAALPAAFFSLTLVYSIIPHRFLQLVLATLYKYGVVYLGYYFVVGAGLLFFGWLIYKAQKRSYIVSRAKKIKHQKEIKQRSLNSSLCTNCGNSVDYTKDRYCKSCAAKLLTECSSCGGEREVIARFCKHCGSA